MVNCPWGINTGFPGMVVFDVVTDFCQFFTIVPYLPPEA
jgi:hypothetical protein